MKKYLWDTQHEWDRLDKEIESEQVNYDEWSEKNLNQKVEMPELLMWVGAIIGFGILGAGIAAIIPIAGMIWRGHLINESRSYNLEKQTELSKKLYNLKHERDLKKALVGKFKNDSLNDEEYESRLSEIDEELSVLTRIKELKEEISYQTNKVRKLELELELAKLTEEKNTKEMTRDAMLKAYNSFQKHLNKNPCPEHGTTPRIKLVGQSISADEYCCEAQLQTVHNFLAEAAKDSQTHE